MPFIRQIPRPFTKEAVEKLKQHQGGVYGILKQGQCLYVGKGDIRERLLAHLNGEIPSIARHNPTHFVADVIEGDPSEREKELLEEMDPVCNKVLC